MTRWNKNQHSSISKISLLAAKEEKLKQYNVEARKVQKQVKQDFHREIMEKYEIIFAKDVKQMTNVPSKLCAPKIQKKFIDAKRNMISRRIQCLIEQRTLNEWQLP